MFGHAAIAAAKAAMAKSSSSAKDGAEWQMSSTSLSKRCGRSKEPFDPWSSDRLEDRQEGDDAWSGKRFKSIQATSTSATSPSSTPWRQPARNPVLVAQPTSKAKPRQLPASQNCAAFPASSWGNQQGDGGDNTVWRTSLEEYNPVLSDAPDTSERKVFVSNLPDGCTEDTLRDYLSKDFGGEVEDVRLQRNRKQESRGRACVLFYDAEAVGIAAQGIHYIHGQRVVVEAYGDNAKSDELRKRKIFVGSLPGSCTGEQLFECFSTIAPVQDAVVMSGQQANHPSTRAGYVLFEDSNGQELAMEASSGGLLQIDGHMLTVKRWGEHETPKSVHEAGRPRKGYVTGIALSCTERDLCDAFRQYGEIANAEIGKHKLNGQPRGYGYITFVDPDDLVSALQDGCKLVKSHSVMFSKKTRIAAHEITTSKRDKRKRKLARRRLKRTSKQGSEDEQTDSTSA